MNLYRLLVMLVTHENANTSAAVHKVICSLEYIDPNYNLLLILAARL